MRKAIILQAKIFRLALLLFAILLCFSTISYAQLLGQEGRKLVGTGTIGYGPQGNALAVSADGNTAIVGSDQDNGNVGAIWFYTRTGTTWSQQGPKMSGTDAVGAPHQGYSVSISADGNTAVVGGYLDSNPMGAATVYTRTDGVWSQQGPKLVGTGNGHSPIQGWSVAISGDGNTILVGGQGDNNYIGAVWAFTRTAGVWTQQGTKITATGTQGTSAVGQSVSLSHDGNTAIVGAKNDSGNTGAAFVFTRTAGVWSQPSGKLVGSEAVGQAWQGNAVGISGDGNTAIVGGYLDSSHTGAAWIFTRSGDNWIQQGAKLVSNDYVGPVQQGSTVSLSYDGNRALVGGWNDNSSVGCAWLYTRSGTVWAQSGGKMLAGDRVGVAKFGAGSALSADGKTAVFGGPYDNGSIGAAWAFSECTTAPPKAAITGAPLGMICSGYKLTVADTSTVGKFITAYSWSDGSTTASSNAITAAGTYTVTITNSCGYTSTVSQVISTVNASPVTLISGPSYFCTGSTATLTASDDAETAGPLTYTWSDGSMMATSNPISTAGTYSVSITNAAGCTVAASKFITSNPISVSSTTGTPACYIDLRSAFDAINLGRHKGAVTILVFGNTEESASCVLNASGEGQATYTSILLQPAGGQARSITGGLSAPLIDLNGADNVTIDGLNTNGNSLSISNGAIGTATSISSIRLFNDASNNTVTRCTILGNAGAGVGVAGGGTISIGAGFITGNDNNTISHCNIGSSNATNNATKHIYAGGTGATINEGLLIDHNNIYNYFRANQSSTAIEVTQGHSGVTISNNKFYQPVSKTFTSGNLFHRAISINNTTGGGFRILKNSIGYADSLGTGIYLINFSTTASANAAFIPIFLNVGTTVASSVEGNIIAGIAISASTMGTAASAPFKGIFVANGLVNIGDVDGNTIGNMYANNSISYTSTGGVSDVAGIYVNSSSNCRISNNKIAGITVNSANANARSFYGIRLAGGSNSWICDNNIIGSSLVNSISSTSTAAAAKMNGIFSAGGTGTFTGNTIRNLTASGGTGTGQNAAVIGISIFAATNQTIARNTIQNLGTASATVKELTAIQMSGTAVSMVDRNFIYGFSSSSATASIAFNGIRIDGGTGTYKNNMIALGEGFTAPASIWGFYETSGQNAILNNSVYIGGTPASGTEAETSAAFASTLAANMRSISNNIFVNARTNTATAVGNHYSILLAGTPGLTINNNLYYITGTGGVMGRLNGADITDLETWRIASAQDANSVYGDPYFVSAAATVPDLHIKTAMVPSRVDATGTNEGIAEDFDGQVRASLTPNDIGADAFVSSTCTWTGAVSSSWSDAANWSCGVVPSDSSNVTIPAVAPNMPVVDITDASCNDITVNADASLTIGAGNALYINGAAVNNGIFSVPGKAVFSGAGQTIPAGTYGYLEIAGSGIKSPGGIVGIANELILTSSNLSLGSYDLQVAATASITGASASSYIITGMGALKQQGIGSAGRTGTVIFPVGTATSYTPLSLYNAGTADEFSVRVLPDVFDAYDANDVPTGSAQTANNVDRTWIVQEGIAGGSDVTLGLQWNGSDELPGFNRAASYVSHYTNNSWNGGTMNIAAGTDPFTLSRSGITSFSPFAVGSMNSVLPLQLLSFTGKQMPGNILLQWVTANEVNVAGFDVERKTGGAVFGAIGTVNADAATGYQYNDGNVVAGTRYYYRLKLRDKDGLYSYSPVISFMAGGETVDKYRLYPNPVAGNYLYLQPLAGNASILVEVVDMLGRIWFTDKPASGTMSNAALKIPVTQLPAGLYTLRINNANGERIQVDLFTVIK